MRPHLIFALMMIENQKQAHNKRPFLHAFFDEEKKFEIIFFSFISTSLNTSISASDPAELAEVINTSVKERVRSYR
jgi:hypothetical protein